jgi:hypothetical protein
MGLEALADGVLGRGQGGAVEEGPRAGALALESAPQGLVVGGVGGHALEHRHGRVRLARVEEGEGPAVAGERPVEQG